MCSSGSDAAPEEIGPGNLAVEEDQHERGDVGPSRRASRRIALCHAHREEKPAEALDGCHSIGAGAEEDQDRVAQARNALPDRPEEGDRHRDFERCGPERDELRETDETRRQRRKLRSRNRRAVYVAPEDLAPGC